MNETIEERLRELESENKRLKGIIKRRDEFIRGTFGRYLTDEVLEEILNNRGSLKIGGERRDVAMLFSDLRHSTKLSEEMDAEDFIRMLNHYFGELIEIVNAWQGNILAFVGDALVVVFGAPRENAFSARNAAACAVAMQRCMPMINVWNREQGYPELSMGIGLHIGEAILGNIGSETRTKYDMIGRNVNLASRIESFTRGGQILASTELIEAAGELVIVNDTGSVWVRPKGIQSDILLHDVVGFGTKMIPQAENE